MMIRWLAYTRLFDFDVRHIKGNKNSAADGLSRRGKGEDDETDSDPDEYFESCLYNITAAPELYLYDYYQVYKVAFNPKKYADDDDITLGKYLATLQRPDGITDSQYQQLRCKAKNFLVRDGLLFKRARKRGILPRRVVGLPAERIQVIEQIHDEKGHLGQKVTYDQIVKRYQWRGIYNDVMEWVKTCDECQNCAKR